MKCRLIAAGTRLPDWINTGFSEYQKRLRTPLVLELKEISVATRRAGEDPQRAVTREGADMLAAIGRDDYVVALEITAKAMSTEQLSLWLSERMRDGRVLSLLVGGPDGLSSQCRARAQQNWSLSPLTLPHGLVRVVVAEQLYRAMSLLAGHPYHRLRARAPRRGSVSWLHVPGFRLSRFRFAPPPHAAAANRGVFSGRGSGRG